MVEHLRLHDRAGQRDHDERGEAAGGYPGGPHGEAVRRGPQISACAENCDQGVYTCTCRGSELCSSPLTSLSAQGTRVAQKATSGIQAYPIELVVEILRKVRFSHVLTRTERHKIPVLINSLIANTL